MAEAVLFTLTNDILKLAGSNIFSKIQLARGARDDLTRLKYTVKTIQTMLLDAEKKQWDSEQVKLWLVRLKDVLYDAQDLLDDVATEDLRRKVTPGNKMSKAVCFFFSKSNQLAQPYKVAKRIQEIRKKLNWIAKDREFRLEEHRSEATVAIVRRRTTDSFVRKEEIIGRQFDEEEISKSLLDSSSKESVSVVSIVGMGGLGKTTLARLAYNNDKVTKYFELKMWACVSDVFDRDFLIKEILKSARDKYQGDPEMTRILQDIDNKCKDELQGLLRKVLDGKKYLLVLDDLWNEDHGKWSELQRLLMGGSLGSKILVTTRNRLVVDSIGIKSGIHYLNILSDNESWDLFKKTAFEDEGHKNQELEQIGQDIVKKCGGVPLAIKTIGNLLYAKEEKEWLYFKDHEFSKIDTLNPGIMEVLKISYDHLQPRLKHCFAYCALFPKDYVFDKETMIQLWMAQGFIESLDEHEEIQEIKDDYVSDLLHGSFLEVEEVNPYTGKVKMFKMHDLMHDLALKVAGNECKMVNLNKGSLDEDTRHASFALQSFSSLQEVTSLLEAANLQTFVSLEERSYVEKFSPNECHRIFSKFRHCRMLKLNYENFCIPSSLGSQLKHLRFLEICENDSIKSLPDSITDLLNLQTLIISTCVKLKALPKDLRKLINLRHLDINECRSLGSLSCLHTLSELSSLRTLSLMFLDALDFDPFQQSSTTRPFFPSLESLILDSCNVKGWWRRREVMIAYQKHQSNNSQLFFPKLRFVDIKDCPSLNFVPPFPQVEYLEIDNITMLEQQFLANLNHPSAPFSELKHLCLYHGSLEPILETLLRLANNLESMRLLRCKLKGLFHGMRPTERRTGHCHSLSVQHLFRPIQPKSTQITQGPYTCYLRP
ncbi:putative disease resistance protein RGA3 [Eucalyptus grandis]|uniref:putative disease resistance protein RGA3 n=1 Tax=Eucalyptus grandis TaxID=71139 RepID=UPI00192EC091|nr:putative disease resistance protein RGA3 [Eucalyptus grandis]